MAVTAELTMVANCRMLTAPFFILIIKSNHLSMQEKTSHQVVIAQWLARRLAAGEVQGSNHGKRDNLLISDLKGKYSACLI